MQHEQNTTALALAAPKSVAKTDPAKKIENNEQVYLDFTIEHMLAHIRLLEDHLLDIATDRNVLQCYACSYWHVFSLMAYDSLERPKFDPNYDRRFLKWCELLVEELKDRSMTQARATEIVKELREWRYHFVGEEDANIPGVEMGHPVNDTVKCQLPASSQRVTELGKEVGKKVIIVGSGASPIAAELARHFVNQGPMVAMHSPADFEDRRQARIDRLYAAAGNARRSSNAAWEASNRALDGIVPGQPILIGHHSEKRHRNAIKRSHAAMDRSVEEQKKAEEYAYKARAAENNRAIFTDDPEAVTKLEEKIADLEALQDGYKKVNAAWRSFKKNPASLDKTDLSEKMKESIRNFTPEYSWEKGPIPSYRMSNNNANIRRLKERLAKLQKVAQDETTEVELGDVTIVDNVEENRVQILFPGKPSSDIRDELKGSGFRYSPRHSAWQRHRSNVALREANRIASIYVDSFPEIPKADYGEPEAGLQAGFTENLTPVFTPYFPLGKYAPDSDPGRQLGLDLGPIPIHRQHRDGTTSVQAVMFRPLSPDLEALYSDDLEMGNKDEINELLDEMEHSGSLLTVRGDGAIVTLDLGKHYQDFDITDSAWVLRVVNKDGAELYKRTWDIDVNKYFPDDGQIEDFDRKKWSKVFKYAKSVARYNVSGYLKRVKRSIIKQYLQLSSIDTNSIEMEAPKDPAGRFRELADKMQSQIDDKLNPAISHQNPTRRRANIAESMWKDGEWLQKYQTAMRGMADAIDAGTLPESLQKVTSRAQIEDILLRQRYSPPSLSTHWIKDLQEAAKGVKGLAKEREILGTIAMRFRKDEYTVPLYSNEEVKAIEKIIKAGQERGISGLRWAKDSITEGKRLWAAGIFSQEDYDQARADLQGFVEPPNPEDKRRRELKILENDLLGVKIPGFFPTPRPVIEHLLDLADIQPGMEVLEPSGGKGDIADAITERHPDVDLLVIEYNVSLANILKAKGYSVVNGDFLEHWRDYDRIVMNPPFEHFQDVAHVRHAYDLLKPGGRVVSIMGEGTFFRNDRTAKEFREWLYEIGGEDENLPAGSFTGAGAFRQTGVNTRVVILDKLAMPNIDAVPPDLPEIFDPVDTPVEANIVYGALHDTRSDEAIASDMQTNERIVTQPALWEPELNDLLGWDTTDIKEHQSNFECTFEAVKTILEGLFETAHVLGRVKTLPSIVKKLKKKNRAGAEFTHNNMEDIAGLRVTFSNVIDLLGGADHIHWHWPTAEEEDYVRNPKDGYRSFHFTVYHDGNPVEIQLRTPNMTKWADWMHDRLYDHVEETRRVIGDDGLAQAKAYAMTMSDYYARLDEGLPAIPPPIPAIVRVSLGGGMEPDRGSLIDIFTEGQDELGNLRIPGDRIIKLLKTRTDAEIKELHSWSSQQSPHVKRNVQVHTSAELRLRGVPVDTIAWQMEPDPEPSPVSLPGRRGTQQHFDMGPVDVVRTTRSGERIVQPVMFSPLSPELEALYALEMGKEPVVKISGKCSEDDCTIKVKATDTAEAQTSSFGDIQSLIDRVRNTVKSSRKPSRKTIAIGPNGVTRYEFEYQLVDLNDVITSHDPFTFERNPKYPADLQPRLRERAATRLQVERIAANLDPDALISDFRSLDRGAPIIGPDKVVESGNGRVMGVIRAQSDHPAKYKQYLSDLKLALASLGLSDKAMNKVKQPLLVRKRLTKVDRGAFAQEANAATTIETSAVEKARTDAEKITMDMLMLFEPSDGGTIEDSIRGSLNRSFVRTFLAKLSDNEQASLIDSSGQLSQDGVHRIVMALFVSAFSGDNGLKLAEKFFESTDVNVKNVFNGIAQALGRLAIAESMMREGQRYDDYSIEADLAKAVSVFSAIKKTPGQTVKKYLDQQQLFERELTPFQEELLTVLDKHSRSGKRIGAILRGYAKRVIDSNSPDQIGLFAEFDRPSKEDFLAQAVAEAGDQGVLMSILNSNEFRVGADIGGVLPVTTSYRAIGGATQPVPSIAPELAAIYSVE